MTTPPPPELTLGILAGGRATRLGGRDKAWLRRGGVPQVLRWTRRWAGQAGTVLVSANRDLDRYREAGILTVVDEAQPAAGEATPASASLGPIAGLAAVARACTTPWLLTLPVDLVDINDCLLPSLAAAGGQGAWAEDDDGPQPLVALWRADALREAAVAAIAAGEFAVHRLQARLGMAGVRLAGVRFGNLNTPADLAAAGFDRHD
ncbi:MAG: NTP transferase domain-containing protein [Proteobacteria bacterium]|nr:NTP transferase domain-containing protein [Pseudomonadota bacterium]